MDLSCLQDLDDDVTTPLLPTKPALSTKPVLTLKDSISKFNSCKPRLPSQLTHPKQSTTLRSPPSLTTPRSRPLSSPNSSLNSLSHFGLGNSSSKSSSTFKTHITSCDFTINVSNLLISNAELTRRLSSTIHSPTSLPNESTSAISLIGILAGGNSVKTSKAGKQYLRWQLSDFKGTSAYIMMFDQMLITYALQVSRGSVILMTCLGQSKSGMANSKLSDGMIFK
ncbi:hypothetical protein GEMRC1_002299 [Eukaryota sp. GEM-RC1]